MRTTCKYLFRLSFIAFMLTTSMLSVAQTVAGTLQLSPYFSDNMVLPRNRVFTLSGVANSDDRVCIKVYDKSLEHNKKKATLQVVRTKAGKDGSWSANIQPLSDKQVYQLVVSAASGTITLNNILAGELWLASGQSNMAFKLNQSSTAIEDIAGAENNHIRLLNLQPRWETNAVVWEKEALDSINALLYYHDAQWQSCTSTSVGEFSAIAYHFARSLQDSLQCPIGIICNAVGGSGEESWIDKETLESGFPEILNNWTENEFIQDWVRGRAKLNMGWHQQSSEHNLLQRHPYQPCYLYDASVKLLKNLPIVGVIWYQGESNAQDMDTHARLFPLLLKSWRETWNNPHLPFIFTQLSSLSRPTWPEFRNLQRLQLYSSNNQIDKTLGMAVSTDVGDSLDVHPRHKRPVGERLTLWALHNVYAHDCVCSGPLFHSFSANANRIEIFFDFANGLTTSDGQSVRTLEYTLDNINWQPASSHIEDTKLIIETNDALHVKGIRYGWQPYTRANLVNAQGLPASTFKKIM